MVGIDNPVRTVGSFASHGGNSLPFLLTDERAQVLDLLKHLITHFSDAIVFCGPRGVGKTRLLEVLQQQEIVACQFYRLAGNEEITMDVLLEQINSMIDRHRFGTPDRVFTALSADAKNPATKTVLMIDDAGSLAPGLCDKLINYADRQPSLIILFVFTHDQLQLKHQTDPGIDDCNVVELPALTEKQCGDFLQHLATQTQDAVTLDVQSEAALPEVFRHTHGIPSKIIEKYVVTPVKNEENPTQVLLIAGSILIVVALAVQFYSSNRTIAEAEAPPALAKKSGKTADFEVTQPILSLPIAETEKIDSTQQAQSKSDGETKPVTSQPRDELRNDQAAPAHIAGIEPRNESPGSQADQPVTTAQSEVRSETLADAETVVDPGLSLQSGTVSNAQAPVQEASAWLSSQPGQHYTLQLMVLSKEDSVFKVINKYPALRKQIKFVRRSVGNKEKYVLLYGSFADAAQALSAKQHMPGELQKSMARKIAAIRKEFP